MGFTFKGLTSNALVSAPLANQPDHKDVADIPAAVDGHTSMDGSRPDEKLGTPRSANSLSGSDDEELNKIDTTAEPGVQAVQAATHVWSKRDLIIAYICLWLLNFFVSFTSSSASTLAPYVTSAFQKHSLTALTGVISSIVAGIWKLPYAKIMNIWGRPFALCLGCSCYIIGLIIMASCNNVKAYCAANTFFYTGYNSIDFSMTVFVADTTKLKNRAFFVAYAASPWLITTWIYGYAVESTTADGGIGWRWNFGIFAIIAPFVCAPLIAIFYINEAKARRAGLIQTRIDNRSFGEKLKYYFIEFDVVGLLILATGLALFLLSFNLYSYQTNQWKSPMIICFIVFGGLLIISFGLWEKYFAPVTFIPWPLLKNRTVIFTYTMAGSLYIGWYIWDSYFYSLLVVMFNQSIPHATYIANIYTMGSCFMSLVYGVLLRYYGKLKVYSFFMGVPLTILGVGLMIKFRQPDENIGYIVMCMIFIAFGGGVLVISEQTTLMAVSKQQDFPALLAVESMIIAIGSAIGQTIAGAIWTGIFPARLMANLPASAMDQFADIYGTIEIQQSFPVGSPTRDAINLSYGETQRYMLIAATCVYIITWVSVGLWQNVDVRTMKQRTVGLI
ncbi:siderophore iron transporter-like protein [Ophiobolus disseminans]|uniref:Siderophore iron transporter-like protein n=1 Tax=Ophiobolus disseminans TaxID=1469910 RepID=A0A6A6ZXW0_9PLEO|nr:siderophore iron transporter-like protein [Ophiobolus disseminans]